MKTNMLKEDEKVMRGLNCAVVSCSDKKGKSPIISEELCKKLKSNKL